MSDMLCLTFEDDNDGTGRLSANVQARGFSGRGSAWFSTTHLIEFAQELARTFPLRADKPLSIDGGFATGEGVMQSHLALTFYPASPRGAAACRVRLATPLYENDPPETQSLVEVEMRTDYEQVRSFARSLEMLANGSVNEAVLKEC